MRFDKGLIGCLGALYLMAAFFLAAAWFGPFWGFGNWHGISILFSRDLVYTTGTVIRFDRAGISRPTFTPVVEYSVGNRRERFYGEGSNSTDFNKGDTVPIAYRRRDGTAFIRTFGEELAVPLLMILFASPFLAMAGWGTYANLRRQRATSVKDLAAAGR